MKDLLKHFVRKGDSETDILRRLEKAKAPEGASKKVQSQWSTYVKQRGSESGRLAWEWKFQNQWATLVSRPREYPRGMLGFEKVLHLDPVPLGCSFYDASPGEVTLTESEDGFSWQPISVNSRWVFVPHCLPSMGELPKLLLSLALSRSQVFDASSLRPHSPFQKALIPQHTPQELRKLLPQAQEGEYSESHIFLFAEEPPFTGLICSEATYRYKAPPTHDHFGIHLRTVPYVLTF